MAIVTGDRYLELLVRFVDANAGPLLEGAVTLRLNPAGLHYVQSRLEALRELEALVAGAPVDYLRAYVSDLGDHRALEHLRRILGLLTSLKVVSALPPPSRDPTPVSLLPFGRLKVLELRGCDLSTSAAKGLLELRHTLERLICHNSTGALRHVFASRIVDIKDSPVWKRLSFVSCACNDLMLMDESLQLLPVAETLDLSRNRFARVDNLRKCMKLRHLDLGFNHLRTIASLSEVSCQIVKLVLRNNALASLSGLENLKSLEGLDLSYNIISSFKELEILTSLSCLESLWLEGNPICYARWYRAHVFSFFSNPDKLKLDETGISKKEYWERHVILLNRQRRLAGHGFYFPAKAVTEDESSTSTKRKKNSRLACIQEDERRRFICSEAADQESVSCNSDNLRKEEDDISDSESKIVGLINRVEYMKKEQSVLWLREFKEWMDQPSVDTVDKCQCLEFKLGHGKGNYMTKGKSQLTYGESSKHASGHAETSENASSSKILESDMSFTEAYTGGRGSQYFDNGKTVSEPSIVNADHVSVTKLAIGGVDSWHDRLKLHSQEQQSSPLEEKGYSHDSSSTVEEGDDIEVNMSSVPLTAIGEISDFCSASRQPVSPPHYQEDILHRRLYLEEEFLQLSVESHSVGSLDSDTSCSDDDSCDSSNSECDSLIVQASDEQVIERPTALLCGNSHFAGQHEKPYLIEDTTISDPCVGQDFSTVRFSLGSHDKPFCTSNGLNNGGYEIESQDVGGIGRQKGKQKLKKREITFSENFGTTELEFQKSNGILDVAREDMKNAYERPSCNAGHIPSSREETSKSALQNHDKKDLPVMGANISLVDSTANSLVSEQDEHIKDFFHTKVADSRTSETCEEVVCGLCVVQLGSESSDFQQSEVAVVRSCKNKLYILLVDATHDRRGTISKVLGYYRPEDIRKIVAGLGLQALRVYMEGDATYLFLTRTVEKLEDLLHVLQVSGSSLLNNGCTLESWEQVQIKLLEKHICGSLKMSLFFYSMLLFWHDRCEGGSWFTRSLILIGGYMLVCIENLVQFGSFTDDSGLSSPYYSLDSYCPIQNILEMVIELRDGRCLTLTLNGVMSANSCLLDKIREENQQEEEAGRVHTWKLKWFSEDNLHKFVTLVSAIHGEITDSPLPVKCMS